MPEYEFERIGKITTNQEPTEEERSQREVFRNKLKSTAAVVKLEILKQEETRNLKVDAKISSQIYLSR